MKIRNLVLAGALLALTTLTADAQSRRGYGNRGYGNWGNSSYNSGRNFYPNNNFNSGYRGGYGFSNGFNNYNQGSGFGFGLGGIGLGARSSYYGQNYSYGTPYYGQSYSYGTPSYGQTYYYSTPSVVVTPQTTVLPATYTVPQTVAQATDTGMRITELNEGTAKRAGLRAGDIILKVNDQRTQTFETLRDVLATSGKSQVDIEFIDSSNNTVQRKSVGVVNTKIGVTVEEVAVDRK